ncbi:DUF6883 domain-containing protein [Nocardia sp. NPDC051750]|uniref:DUF6883 domain-containing protein n=1 Tax=Nocardia sp. NPDC051750 TaxID=3364325 RepID=UPI0037A0A238
MTYIDVAPSVYFDAAKICGEAAAAFFEAVTHQFGELAGHTKDMAGSIGDGQVWAVSYDQQTTDAYLLVKSLIGAIDNYAGILIEAGYNYAIADYGGNGPVPERPTVPNSSLLSCPISPPSAGGSGEGLLDDGLDLATQIGVPIPDGDADKLAKAAACWNSLATGQATTKLPAELERAAVSFQAVTAPDASFVDEDLREMKSAAEDLLNAFADLATACRDQEAAHRKQRSELAAVLKDMAYDIGQDIAVDLALYIAASAVTFGMGATAVAAIRGGRYAQKVIDYVAKMRKVMGDFKLKTTVTFRKPISTARQQMQRILDLVKKRADDTGDHKPDSPGTKKPSPGSTEDSVNKKLTHYLLNQEHPVGGPKAKWFEQALGYTKENQGDLEKQIKFDPEKAVETGTTQYGTKYNQTIPIVGANGRTIEVNFAWIRNEDGVVRLVTAIPTKK